MNEDEKTKKILATVPAEELEAAPTVTPEDILKALEKGRQQRLSFEASTHPAPYVSRIRYR